MLFRNVFLLFLFSLLLAGFSWGESNHCGTIRLAHSKQKPQHFALQTSSLCTDDDYIGIVLNKKTEHFQIFYTLSGPHKTTEEFVEFLAETAEFSYDFFTQKMGMRPPSGIGHTEHYLQTVESGLYPIEVLDLNGIRSSNKYSITSCNACFGLTIPDEETSEKSIVLIDNDFRYSSSKSPKDTLHLEEKDCVYSVADQEIMNSAHQYTYSDHWKQGIQITTIHELYHAVQMRYLDFYKYENFWFEASAIGMEEIVYPDIDDYYPHLSTLVSSAGLPLDELPQDYSACAFFIYLYNHYSHNTDPMIWDAFSKRRNASFWNILNSIFEKKNYSADSIFQDFATKLSFSGPHSKFIDSTLLINSDQGNWPAFKFISKNDSTFTPQVNVHAFQFYSAGQPLLEEFKGKASLVVYQDDNADIHNLSTSNEAQSLYFNYGSSADSLFWIFSRYDENETLPTIIKDSTLRAYPTPWRNGNLCFTPLPSNKEFIEIRNRRGDLILREEYQSTTHCIDEKRVKKTMTPGVYRFRAGHRGKTKDLMIVY